jgi:ligand-binding sensor domain-containing protein/signal transduction histidine kinase
VLSLLRLIVLTLLGSATVVHAQPSNTLVDQYMRRDWGTRDGLPQNSVTSIVQTRDGYLWLGTFGGLVRFDGQRFTVFDPENTPGLSNARIVTLHEDRSGVLWIGTESGLVRYQQGQFTSYTTRDGLPHNRIMSIFDDRRGRLWVGTGSAIARFEAGRIETLPFDAPDAVALAFAEMPNGEMWITTIDGIARWPDGGAPVVVQRTPSPATARLMVDSKGRLWSATATLQRWDGGQFIDVPLPAGYGAVQALAEDAHGTIWIATWSGGVFTWTDSAGLRPAATNTFAQARLRSMIADRDGNVWIGTDVSGLSRLSRRRAFSYERPDTAAQSIGPIVGDGSDGLWIGATCGGLIHFRHGAFRTYGKADGLPHDCVWALHRDEDGTLWIGTMGGGLARLANGHIRSWGRRDGMASALVSGLMRDKDGALWLATDLGVTRFANERFTNYGAAEGVPGSMLTITQDRSGALWFGGLGGLTRYADGVFTTFDSSKGLSNNHVRSIHEDADGVLWIGTYGGGLNRYKDGRFTSVGIKNGLHDNAVSRIIEDDRGNLWMSGNKGIFRVARSQLNEFAEGHLTAITSVSYGTADGMIVEETNGGQPAGWRARDGRLWFPTIKGLVSIEPDAAPPAPPPVYIEQTIIKERDAEFHFTAVDLSAGEKTKFRYRLIGYDRDWIESGPRREAYYTNLPPGRFQFEVAATDSDGVWGVTAARAALTVLPFWWERREVQAALLLVLLAITGYGVRFLSLRRSRARLAELVREQALERERSRIARDLHDDVGSQLSHIALMAARAGSGEEGQRLAVAARSAVQTLDELVWSVNARNDTVESFAYYVAQYAEEHVAAAKLRCRLALPTQLPSRPLAADTRRHLFLAFKEALNNALKHAQASEIRVSLEVGENSIVLEVADNGRGLSASVMDPTGNGLANLKERMEAVQGSLAIDSKADTGTRLTFTVPLAAHLHALAPGFSPANTESSE